MNQKNLLNETFAKHVGLLHKKLKLNEETLTFKTAGPKVFNNYKGFAFDAIAEVVFKTIYPGETDVVFDSSNIDNAFYIYKGQVQSGKLRIVDAIQKIFKLLQTEYPDFKIECKPEAIFKNGIECFINNKKIAKVEEDNIEVYN